MNFGKSPQEIVTEEQLESLYMSILFPKSKLGISLSSSHCASFILYDEFCGVSPEKPLAQYLFANRTIERFQPIGQILAELKARHVAFYEGATVSHKMKPYRIFYNAQLIPFGKLSNRKAELFFRSGNSERIREEYNNKSFIP